MNDNIKKSQHTIVWYLEVFCLILEGLFCLTCIAILVLVMMLIAQVL